MIRFKDSDNDMEHAAKLISPSFPPQSPWMLSSGNSVINSEDEIANLKYHSSTSIIADETVQSFFWPTTGTVAVQEKRVNLAHAAPVV